MLPSQYHGLKRLSLLPVLDSNLARSLRFHHSLSSPSCSLSYSSALCPLRLSKCLSALLFFLVGVYQLFSPLFQQAASPGLRSVHLTFLSPRVSRIRSSSPSLSANSPHLVPHAVRGKLNSPHFDPDGAHSMWACTSRVVASTFLFAEFLFSRPRLPSLGHLGCFTAHFSTNALKIVMGP